MNNNFELEESLAKLSFYLNVCLKDKDYDFCKKEYSEIADMVNKWIDIYATDKSLKAIPESDIKKAQKIFYSISFTEYKGFYYFEYIDAFLDKISYFHNQSFDKNNKSKKE